jgi:hypothetical protein
MASPALTIQIKYFAEPREGCSGAWIGRPNNDQAEAIQIIVEDT